MRRKVPRHNVRPHLFDVVPRHVDVSFTPTSFVPNLQPRLEIKKSRGAISLPTHLYIPQREKAVSIRKIVWKDKVVVPEAEEPAPASQDIAGSLFSTLATQPHDLVPPDILPSREALVELMTHFEKEEQARLKRIRGYTWEDLTPPLASPDLALDTSRISWEEVRALVRSLLTRGLKFSLAGAAIVFLAFGVGRGLLWVDRELEALAAALAQEGARSIALLEEGQDLFLVGKFESALKRFRAVEQYLPIPSQLTALASLVPFPDKWEAMLAGSRLLKSASRLGESASLLALALSSDTSSQERPRLLRDFELSLRDTAKLATGLGERSLPPELAASILQLTEARRLLTNAVYWLGPAKSLAGFNGERAYLLLFQNNSELRATGGFIGTYGLLKVKDGAVVDFWVDDVYNRDGQLLLPVAPPRALKVITETWGLRDSNWFFDFPTSARKAVWFFEQAGGESVDGVIALTPSLISELLILTGPIVVPGEFSVNGEEVSVDAVNLIEVLQREVYEARAEGATQPKTFVKEFGAQFFERVSSVMRERPSAVWEAIRSSLNDKELLLWLREQELHARIAAQGWDGGIHPATGSDYLAVVISNIKGFKADYVTQNEFSYSLLPSEGGSLLAELTIRRAHLGKGAPYAWWRRDNRSWVRIFAPLGSRLLEVEGDGLALPLPPLRQTYGDEFAPDPDLEKIDHIYDVRLQSQAEVLEEHGKTVFAAWMEVPAGSSRTLTFRYILPASLTSAPTYRLLWQKQPGVSALYSARLPDGREVTGALERDIVIE